jgi:hypothetical protein
LSHFSRIQVAPLAHPDYSHHFCKADLLCQVLRVVASTLADMSLRSHFVPSLYPNPLSCVDSCPRPPPAVQKVLGNSFRSQFDVKNRLLPSVFLLLSLLLT